MSTATLNGASLTAAQEKFEAALPAILATASFAFRHRRPQDRAEAIAETQAAAWSAWSGLVRRGHDPVEVGVCGIANNAVRNVLQGRRVGNTNRGRGCIDVMDRRAQHRLGIKIVTLDEPTGTEPASRSDGWRDWLAESNLVTPADEAAFRVDFGRWLADLPKRKRMIAEMLAEGNETGTVAKKVGVSDGRVSQVRLELEANWRQYQRQAGSVDVEPVQRPRGRPEGSDQGALRRPRLQTAVPVLEQVS